MSLKCTYNYYLLLIDVYAKSKFIFLNRSFTKKLEKLYEVDEHNTISLECETSHTVSTKWFHNGKELTGMDHREVIQEGRTHRLYIKRVKITDEGTYQCTVKDQKTQTTVKIHRKLFLIPLLPVNKNCELKT